MIPTVAISGRSAPCSQRAVAIGGPATCDHAAEVVQRCLKDGSVGCWKTVVIPGQVSLVHALSQRGGYGGEEGDRAAVQGSL